MPEISGNQFPNRTETDGQLFIVFSQLKMDSLRCPLSVFFFSSASRTRYAIRRARTVAKDNSSTRLTKCRNLCARTLKTFRAISGFLRQACRKLSADSRSRVVGLLASALAGHRPPSKTATSASELPLRSVPRSCCLPLNADLTIFTIPSLTIRSSRHTSPLQKLRSPLRNIEI